MLPTSFAKEEEDGGRRPFDSDHIARGHNRNAPKRSAKLVKAVLILLACLASAGSIVKASKDESDKQFMKTALTATLIPSNSSHAKLWDDVDERAREHGFDNVTCHHSPDGMTCFLSSKSGDKHATLVFNKSDIAEMYANQIGQSPICQL